MRIFGLERMATGVTGCRLPGTTVCARKHVVLFHGAEDGANIEGFTALVPVGAISRGAALASDGEHS